MERILYYDIETTPLKAYIWRLGDQYVRHDQLVEGFHYTDIICIAYCWNDGKPAKVLHWDYQKQDSAPMLKKFDQLVNQADIVIGKNSDRFDNKHINTLRMLANHDGMPDWLKYTDDLEKQIRKHFALPSNSLDYISRLLGIGGKMKMEFQDWINIVERKSKASFKKMLDYNKKDVEDTRTIWEHCSKHFTPKHIARRAKGDLACDSCGSKDVIKNGTKWRGAIQYQRYYCNAHKGTATRVRIGD